ncbi:cysteine peptidase family C39 domain-containing protein [Pirellulaceae bacterium SH449]
MDDEPGGPIPYADFICGPRCVREVLTHFDIPSDVIDLAREMQWPKLEAGASLERIKETLESRGLFTHALNLKPNQSIEWPYPVIFHLNVGGAKIGHFQVLCPRDDGWLEVKDGLRGSSRMSHYDWAGYRSGAVLLVSSKPIEEPDTAIKTLPNRMSIMGVAITLGGTLMLFFLVPRVWIKKSC